jgi:hypothetical protein
MYKIFKVKKHVLYVAEINQRKGLYLASGTLTRPRTY